MISSGLIHGIGTSLPPQKRSSVEVEALADGSLLVAFLQPLTDPDGIDRLAARGVVAFAMESVPRITRAQSMDALSSQATVAGYKAALIAADRLPRFLPMLMTAAGTIPPAKVLVLGAGVAGLQAIATARRLGADTGGNCELTRPGEVVDEGGVTIVGTRNLPSTMAAHASQLLSRNMQAI